MTEMKMVHCFFRFQAIWIAVPMSIVSYIYILIHIMNVDLATNNFNNSNNSNTSSWNFIVAVIYFTINQLFCILLFLSDCGSYDMTIMFFHWFTHLCDWFMFWILFTIGFEVNYTVFNTTGNDNNSNVSILHLIIFGIFLFKYCVFCIPATLHYIYMTDMRVIHQIDDSTVANYGLDSQENENIYKFKDIFIENKLAMHRLTEAIDKFLFGDVYRENLFPVYRLSNEKNIQTEFYKFRNNVLPSDAKKPTIFLYFSLICCYIYYSIKLSVKFVFVSFYLLFINFSLCRFVFDSFDSEFKHQTTSQFQRLILDFIVNSMPFELKTFSDCVKLIKNIRNKDEPYYRPLHARAVLGNKIIQSIHVCQIKKFFKLVCTLSSFFFNWRLFDCICYIKLHIFTHVHRKALQCKIEMF